MNPSIADAETPLAGDILIVDDTPANLRLLSSMLGEQGYKVRLASNGKLALMGAQAVPPDLILLDIKMPSPNGYEWTNAQSNWRCWRLCRYLNPPKTRADSTDFTHH